MKRIFLAVTITLLSAFAFSQEYSIVVAPFEVRAGAGFSKEDAETIEYLFLNELSNYKSTIKVYDQSNAMFKETTKQMKFELSDWSDPKKVAEFGKAINANAVVLGRIMTLGNEIIIAARINYLTTTEIRAANNMIVKDVKEVRGKLPDFTEEIVDKLKPTQPPPKATPKPLKLPKLPSLPYGYTIYNSLAIIGYVYSHGLPLGFSFGLYGIYTSLDFALPDFGGYEKLTQYSSEYDSTSYTEQRYEIVNWALGYNITIIPKRLYLPVGVGIETVREYRLITKYSSAKWYPASKWKTELLFEAGLLFRPRDDYISPYIFGSYKYILPKKQNFSIGIGISFED